jgi:hypothetical protein
MEYDHDFNAATPNIFVCHTYDIVDIDMIDPDFHYLLENGYSVIEWEYDMSQIFDKEILYNYAINRLITPEIFPTVRQNYFASEDPTYIADDAYFYKSQVILYDPGLYNEMSLILYSFQLQVDNNQYEFQKVADDSLGNFLDSLTGGLFTALDYIMDAANASLNYLDQPSMIDQVCEYMGTSLDPSYEEFFVSVCKVVVPRLIEAGQTVAMSAVEAFFENYSFMDLISDVAETVSIELLMDVIGNIVLDFITSNPAISVIYSYYELLYQFAQYSSNTQWANNCATVSSELDYVLNDMETYKAGGNNLRIDYVIESVVIGDNSLFAPIITDSQSRLDAINWLENLFNDAWTRRLYISVAPSSIVISEGMYSAYVQSNEPGVYSQNVTIKGNISIMNQNQFLTEFESVLVDHDPTQPIQVFSFIQAVYDYNNAGESLY